MSITDRQLDLLKELINIGICRGAGVLNNLFKSHINLQVPFLKLIPKNKLHEELQDQKKKKIISIALPFKGCISGTVELAFSAENASNLVLAFTGKDVYTPELDSIRESALTEIGNIVLNSVMGSIGNILKTDFTYFVPQYNERFSDELLDDDDDDNNTATSSNIFAWTNFTIDNLETDGHFYLIFEMSYLSELLTVLENSYNN